MQEYLGFMGQPQARTITTNCIHRPYARFNSTTVSRQKIQSAVTINIFSPHDANIGPASALRFKLVAVYHLVRLLPSTACHPQQPSRLKGETIILGPCPDGHLSKALGSFFIRFLKQTAKALCPPTFALRKALSPRKQKTCLLSLLATTVNYIC